MSPSKVYKLNDWLILTINWYLTHITVEIGNWCSDKSSKSNYFTKILAKHNQFNWICGGNYDCKMHVYSVTSQWLMWISVLQDPIAISGISVMVKSYRVEYFSSVTGNFCGPITTLNLMNESTCAFNGICKVQRDLILPESCGNDDVDVTISATTVLGTGPPTQSSRIGRYSIKIMFFLYW